MSIQARNGLSVSGRNVVETPTNGISEQEKFDLLSSSRRRYIVRALADSEEVATEDLARELSALENDKPIADLTRKEYRNLRIPLVQTHLPQLEEAGVVEYESTTMPIRKGSKFETVAELLDDDVSAWERVVRLFSFD